jgi:orotate phosphoribosyltransferase
MKTEDVLNEFRKVGALLEGHFILSSGRRSPVFLQKALVFSEPKTTERLCAALARKLAAQFGRIDVVVGPAVGGLIPGYETARQLGCRSIYTEREGGVMSLRRGFTVGAGDRVIIVEDIVTTGISMRETLEALKGVGANVIGAACIVDRSNGKADVGGLKLCSLAAVDFPDYDANALPPDLAKIPAIKPGSRGLK